MGVNFQLDLAWANVARGMRQCQKADNALVEGNTQSAEKHLDEALSHFAVAVDHLAKAEDDANVKASKLIDAGNAQLREAVDRFTTGDTDQAAKHYDKALDKYDEALDLVV